MKAIFPVSIDGDLLKLVHLSNGFRLIPGATPLVAGDVCIADARISSVKNTDAGKVVKVKGHVFRDGEPVIEVVSRSFTAAVSSTSRIHSKLSTSLTTW
jgi:fatty acid synthase subunit beta